MSRRSSSSSLLACGLLAVLTMASCRQKTIYSHYEHTPVAGWARSDTLDFSVNRVTQEGDYREEIGLRTSISYPFTGLTLIVEQHALVSGMERTDTLNARLASADGIIEGQGISCFQYSFHLANLTLPQGDTLQVKIRHNMKREVLPGILDVGVMLTRME